jgi:hypothetical protein
MLMVLPLAICAVCIVTSIIGSFFVRLGKSQNIMGALYQGLIVTGVLSIGAVGWVIDRMVTGPVVAAGGRETRERQDMGYMYGRAFEDPDGHVWEPMFMDMAAAQQAMAQPDTTAA